MPLPSNVSLPVFAPRQTLSFDAGGAITPTGRLSPSGRLSPAFSRHRHSHARSISTLGREQLRGLQREEPHPYRNSDVSLHMREEFMQSSIFKSLDGNGNGSGNGGKV
jgi:hypothetical protein